MFLRFLKLPKYQRYEYKPRYWDPEKEELEKRMQQIRDRQNGVSADAVRSRIASGGIRRGFAGSSRIRQQQTKAWVEDTSFNIRNEGLDLAGGVAAVCKTPS